MTRQAAVDAALVLALPALVLVAWALGETFWITLATEKVLPLPVTPSSVWCASPDSMPSIKGAMAAGWSPAGA